MPANIVCVKEWLNSLVYSIGFRKTYNWFMVMFIKVISTQVFI